MGDGGAECGGFVDGCGGAAVLLGGGLVVAGGGPVVAGAVGVALPVVRVAVGLWVRCGVPEGLLRCGSAEPVAAGETVPAGGLVVSVTTGADGLVPPEPESDSAAIDSIASAPTTATRPTP